MKRLLPDEERALVALSKYPAFAPGDAVESDQGQHIVATLKQLVRKGRATVSASDDGPVFRINSIGRTEAAKIEAAG